VVSCAIHRIIATYSPGSYCFSTSGLTEGVRDPAENSGNVHFVVRPGAVMLDRVAQQHARAATGICTDHLATGDSETFTV